MKPGLVAILFNRADRCECGCGQWFEGYFGRPTVDHFWGRAKADETPETLWLLREDHHRAKTDSEPSAIFWVEKFVAHLQRNGFDTTRAQSKLTFLLAKKGLSEAARERVGQ